MWLEYHNILFLLDTLVLRCPAGESLVGYRLSLYPLSPQLHWLARIRMHWFRSGSGVWQHLNWNIFSLLPPNIGLIFKTMWKFPHDSPSDFIQTKIVPTSTTNKLDLTIRATSSRYKGLFNNVHQWHQSPISVTDVHHLYFWKILCIPTLWTYEVACREVTKCHKVTSFPIFKPLHENRS